MDQGCHRNSVSTKNAFLRNARFLTSTTGRSPLDLFDPTSSLRPGSTAEPGRYFFPSWGSYGSMATSSGSPLPCRPATGWGCLAVIAESSASVVRRASCTLAPFRHSHPVPFLIRAKNIFSESDFSWAYCFHSHFHQSTAVTDNFQQVSIQRVSPSVSLNKLFLVITTCYRQTTSANSSGWLTMIAPDWHCQTYKNNTAKWSRINYTMLK